MALAKLRALGFKGSVFVPETETWDKHDNYDAQIAWELEALKQASVIVFWIPRDLNKMPAFTTNVEFGFWVQTGKVLLGAPDDAQKMGYLKALAERYQVPVFDNLDDLLKAAIDMNTEIARSTTTNDA